MEEYSNSAFTFEKLKFRGFGPFYLTLWGTAVTAVGNWSCYRVTGCMKGFILESHSQRSHQNWNLKRKRKLLGGIRSHASANLFRHGSDCHLAANKTAVGHIAPQTLTAKGEETSRDAHLMARFRHPPVVELGFGFGGGIREDKSNLAGRLLEQQLKTSVNGNKQFNVWHRQGRFLAFFFFFFLGRNPHARFSSSSHKCVFLKNEASC